MLCNIDDISEILSKFISSCSQVEDLKEIEHLMSQDVFLKVANLLYSDGFLNDLSNLEKAHYLVKTNVGQKFLEDLADKLEKYSRIKNILERVGL